VRFGFRSPNHLAQAVRRGEFPRPVKIGKRAIAWLESDLQAWLAERIAERDAA
jgi:prophage regulatory protein